MFIRRVNTLPAELAASTIYLVKAAENELKVVVTGTTATVVSSTKTPTELNAHIDSRVALNAGLAPSYVSDITARDAMIPSLTKNQFILVADATGDSTVAAGAALYFFIKNEGTPGGTFTKVSEFESMDVVIPNADILEKFSDVGGQLKYDGVNVGNVVASSPEW